MIKLQITANQQNEDVISFSDAIVFVLHKLTFDVIIY